MFFDLLEDVFHLDHDDLHLGLIGFGAESIDFAAHFLGYKAEFFADSASFGCHGLTEVFDMIGEAHFLFGDIEFLEVINHLLFQSVMVDICGKLCAERGQVLLQPFFDLRYATFLERFYLR